jgi:hypothetical protein
VPPWIGSATADVEVRYVFTAPTPMAATLALAWSTTTTGNGNAQLVVDVHDDGSIDAVGGGVLPVSLGPSPLVVRVRGRVAASGGTTTAAAVRSLCNQMRSVRAAAATVRGRAGLHGLLLNAGIVHPPRHRQTTADGHEIVFATNALGHYALAGELRKHFATENKVTIHEVALSDQNGPRVLRDDGCSSYLDGVASPRASVGIPPGGTVSVLCRTVDYYDRGDIDLLAIDTEGSEWPVISGLVSRPWLICVEMGWQHYVNPHADEIRQWMAWQGYRLAETDGQDEVYVR